MDDLYQELWQKMKQLDAAIRELRASGTEKAKTERDYKVLLRTECLKMKDAGMAVGLIDKTCYGIPSVAEKRFQRDAAEVVYTANLEAINATKLQIRIIDEVLKREWGASD